jgi:lipopolysaccharide/colanic/teichoic acid biosynthesis glycosyltransferase
MIRPEPVHQSPEWLLPLPAGVQVTQQEANWRAQVDAAAARTGEWDRWRLEEAVFLDALRREHRRADRFEKSFQLILVKGRKASASLPVWNRITEAFVRAKPVTDVIGWVATGRALGLIVTDTDARDLTDQAPSIARRLLQVLESEPAACRGWSVELHTCPASSPASFVLADAETSPLHDGLKRILDIVGSLILLTIFAPLFLVVAALIKLTSPGPILFRQVRVGHSNGPFTMLKFRTMRTGADARLHQEYVTKFIHGSAGAAHAARQPLFKITDDPRVTPIGHLLRRLSIDELPQFWNVFRGDMSLVGPRPPLPYEVEQYKPWHVRRVLEAKPGITGLWQVRGRSRTTFDDMVRLDLRYARERSIWTDIKILLATPRAVLTGKGAY